MREKYFESRAALEPLVAKLVEDLEASRTSPRSDPEAAGAERRSDE
jgi:hypothetical protein